MYFSLSLQVRCVTQETDEEILAGKLDTGASQFRLGTIAILAVSYMLIDDCTGQNPGKADSVADLLDGWACASKRRTCDIALKREVSWDTYWSILTQLTSTVFEDDQGKDKVADAQETHARSNGLLVFLDSETANELGVDTSGNGKNVL